MVPVAPGTVDRMADDAFAKRMAAAASKVAEVEAQNGPPRPSRKGARARLLEMADSAESETVRLNAVKALGELDVKEAKVRALAQAAQGPVSPLADLSPEALAELRDDALSADLTALLRSGPPSALVADLPRSRAVVDGTLERIVAARVKAELARLADPAEFERRVEARAAELADARVDGLVADRLAAMRAELADAAADLPAPIVQSEPADDETADAARAEGSTPRKVRAWPEERPQRAGLLGGSPIPPGLGG
jgi:hypothetical protein